MARTAKPVAILSGTSILPDDSVSYRLSGQPVPHNGSLALISYANSRDVLCANRRAEILTRGVNGIVTGL